MAQSTNQTAGQTTGKRGFSSMDEEKQRPVPSPGAKSSQEKNIGREFNEEDVHGSGRKGGEAIKRDREPLSPIGSEGGQSRKESVRPGMAGEEDYGNYGGGQRGGFPDNQSDTGKQGNKNT